MKEYHHQLKTLPIGQTLSVRHLKCPASGGGEDSKKRLRFTRTNRSTVLYYCHHCGKKGRVKDRVSKGEPVEGPYKPPGGRLPSGHSVTALFPQKCQDWLNKAHITGCYDKGIVWDDSQGRLILPCRSRGGELLGYQARGFGKDPKYITKGFGRALYHWSEGESNETLVVVEDILSAIRLSAIGYSAVALLRTTINKELLLEVLNYEPECAVIWLDNDNPTVKRLARRLVHTLKGYGVLTLRVADRIDPKYYTDDELTEIMGELI